MRRPLLVALTLPFLACGSDATGPEDDVLCEPREVDESRVQKEGLDGVFLGIARIEPGFAGLLVRDGALEISVAAGYPIDEEAYRAAVRRMMGPDPFYDPSGAPRPVAFRRVDFTWPQLVAAYQAVSHCLFAIEGVVSVDIDEERNRVTVGVLDEETADAIRAFVDEEKFFFEVTGLVFP